MVGMIVEARMVDEVVEAMGKVMVMAKTGMARMATEVAEEGMGRVAMAEVGGTVVVEVAGGIRVASR